MQLGAGHLRRADALVACADKRCPSDADPALRAKIDEALGRTRKLELGEALAAPNPEVAADMLVRLGVGAPRARAVRVAPGPTLGLSMGRVVTEGEAGESQREVLLYDPKTWTPRMAIAGASFSLSPDGQSLVVDGRLYDPILGTSATFPAGEVTFSPDSQRMAIVTGSSVTIVGLVKRATSSAPSRPNARSACGSPGARW